jgi:uncharacterized membrane protein
MALIKSPLVSHLVQAGLAGGAAAAAFAWLPQWLKPSARIVSAYDAFALTMLVWYWFVVMQKDAGGAGRRAAKEDPGRNVVVVLVVCSVAFGFASALEILGKGPLDANPNHAAFLYVIGLGAVVLGWLLINTTFLFRYARLYYQDRDHDKRSDGGLIFPGGEEPNDHDFAYFSFVIGMTFQVSDVQITSRTIRKLALAHAMISFGYNVAVLALTVNVLSGILHG